MFMLQPTFIRSVQKVIGQNLPEGFQLCLLIFAADILTRININMELHMRSLK